MKLNITFPKAAQDLQISHVPRLNVRRLALAMAILIATAASWQWAHALPVAQAAYSGNNGQIALTSDRDGAGYDIHVVNSDGTGRTNITNTPAIFDQSPDWSPDGTMITFTTNRDGNFEIYEMNSNGTVPVRLTNNGAFEGGPRYSPDGTKIAFETDRDGNSEIYVMNTDGSGTPANFTNNGATDTNAAWSPDGTKIAFTSNRDGNQEIYVAMSDGSGVPIRITNNPASDAGPAWSPDGTQIVFASTRFHANGDVFVMNADGTAQTALTNQASLDGRPDWSPDGLQILFDSNRDDNNGDNFVMNADGTGTPTNVTPSSPSFEFTPDWQSLPISNDPQFLFKFGSIGSANSQFINPHDVATDSTGNIYVTDGNNNRIQVFDSNGGHLFNLGSFGTGDGQFKFPEGIAIGSTGDIYVADAGNHRVQVFDSAGTFIFKFGSLGSSNGQFFNPPSVALDASGNIYVADISNHRVQVFDSAGTFLFKFGTPGSGNGQFNNPGGVIVNTSGNIFVSERSNHRVQVFDSSGNFLYKFGSLGSGDGLLNTPHAIDLDNSGDLYVTDLVNNRVQKFDSAGNFLLNFGTFCNIGTLAGCVDPDGVGPLAIGDGQFWQPGGIAIDLTGNIVVAGTPNNRIQVFGVASPNEAPEVGPITAPLDPVTVGSTINASAPFTDADVLDTHTAIWEWGDGSQCDTSVDLDCSVTEAGGSGTTNASHIYATPGVYTLEVTVFDNDGASDSSTYQYVVVYDPTDGFVTGGGWINSPLGAYAADLTLTGKANFGFVSKYKKGATVPTGQTEFQFKAAGLNFHSDTYQWLVVAGANAKFKGTGTINGSGNYGFMVTATDEKLTASTSIDLFRIKIWDIDNGDAVVYDNQVGEPDDSTAGTTISGGNISIK